MLARNVIGGGLSILLSAGAVGCGDAAAGGQSGTDDGSSTGVVGTTATQTSEDAAATTAPGTTEATTGGPEGSDTSSGPPATTEPATTTAGSTTSEDTEGTTGGPPVGPYTACYEGVFVNNFPGPNYDSYELEIGSHCLGTNQQAIDDVERVVFLGDSVTVGTPPSQTADYYRVRLADALADRFSLQFGSNKLLWQLADVINGTSVARDSGDFSSCAKWGARNDDLLAGNQLADCFPKDVRDRATLTVITSGGNDLAKIARDAQEGAAMGDLWALAQSAVDHKRDSIRWLTDPKNFPNGNHVVFGNVYEFTDGTGDVGSCQFAGLAGFDGGAPLTPTTLVIVAWLEDQYAQIAVETGADFIFMFEEFCGHGFNSQDPEATCYRGPGNANYFDLTCIHPTPAGHAVLADMFLATISE